MSYGIILEGDTSPLVEALAERLSSLGLYRGSTDTLTAELIGALNIYRASNHLIPLDFCDPATLRTLGIEAEGDEILTLARYGDAVSDTELGCYDACREIVNESRALGITLTEAICRRAVTDENMTASSEAVTAAVLALIGN